MSIWPRRRPALPGYARAWLDPDERVLAFSSTPDGVLVVATPRGLWIADHRPGEAADEPAGRLLAWESIVSAAWARDVLTVITAAEVQPQIMRRLPALSLPLPEPSDVPRVVRQRVDRSVAVSHRRVLETGSTVLLVGRRSSGRDGLVWYAVFDRDSDTDDPQACRQVTAMLESAAAATARPDL